VNKLFGPVIAAGALIGFGLGGLIESIVFRQILGAHAFLSTSRPVKAVADLKASLMWDGVLQVLLVAILAVGIVSLYKAAKRTDVFFSGQLLFGSWFLGWGIFVLLEGALSHHVFGLHHLLEYANPAAQETGDYAYLIVGALLAILGYWAVSSTRTEMEEQARSASRATQRAKEARGDRKVYLD
jgi:uncharacterized membrane protein